MPSRGGDAETPDYRGLGADAAQFLAGVRTLDREDRTRVGDVVNLDAVRVHLRQRARDAIGVRRVGHDVERDVVDPPHDDVVDHRRVLRIEQVRVLRAAGPDLAEIVGECRLQHVERAHTVHTHGAEMADVEHHRVSAAGTMLGERAGLVVQRHVPSAEWDELGAERPMLRVERRVLQHYYARAAAGSSGRAG